MSTKRKGTVVTVGDGGRAEFLGAASAATAPPDVVTVRFIRADAPFNRGDLHTCSAAAAEKLIRHGVAERVEG